MQIEHIIRNILTEYNLFLILPYSYVVQLVSIEGLQKVLEMDLALGEMAWEQPVSTKRVLYKNMCMFYGLPEER